MKVVEETQTVQFDVLGYQFPDSAKSKPNDYNYDANRLTIKVARTTKDGTNEYAAKEWS